MSLVSASARRVEMANLMASSRRDWVLRFSESPEFLDVDPEAAVALDGSGRIIGMTKGAEKLALGRTAPFIGCPIQDLLELSVDDLPDLMRGRPTEDRVVRLKDGRALFGHAIAPQSAPVPPRERARAKLGALAGISGNDPAMEHIAQRAFRLAGTQLPVLILGETGTGKEHLARAIHVSGRSGRSFHAVRCAGLTRAGIEALIEMCPGTLFLRGIDDLSDAAQGALLWLLDCRDDLRIISSAEPGFGLQTSPIRADLFFRLSGATFALPALRMRRDFDWLLDRLLRRRAPLDVRLSPAARIDLAGRNWPGNIRELIHALDLAVASAEGSVIDVPDLPPRTSEHMRPEQDLEALLQACQWNMSQAARRLGVNRSTVLRRVRKLGLTPPN
jgi:transcriptional regulator of acetoin/glycerol metabolism